MIKLITQQTKTEADIYAEVSALLISLGIPPNLKGYKYLVEAVQIVYNDFDSISNIMKAIYHNVAEKYNTTPSRVERAIRHAIEIAFYGGNDNIIEMFSGLINSKRTKPANSEFIAMIAEQLNIKHMKE